MEEIIREFLDSDKAFLDGKCPLKSLKIVPTGNWQTCVISFSRGLIWEECVLLEVAIKEFFGISLILSTIRGFMHDKTLEVCFDGAEFLKNRRNKKIDEIL